MSKNVEESAFLVKWLMLILIAGAIAFAVVRAREFLSQVLGI